MDKRIVPRGSDVAVHCADGVYLMQQCFMPRDSDVAFSRGRNKLARIQYTHIKKSSRFGKWIPRLFSPPYTLRAITRTGYYVQTMYHDVRLCTAQYEYDTRRAPIPRLFILCDIVS